VLQGHSTVRGSQHDPTPPMPAPGGLARRFWGNASANGMPATSSREHSPPNNMARHLTLRRAMASASAEGLCILRVMKRQEVQRLRKRQDRLCRRQAPLHGTSGATRPPIECPRRHRANTHRLISWRVTDLYGAQRRWRRRRCRVLASAFQSGSSRSQSSDSVRC